MTALTSSVVVLYPESLHKLSLAKQEAPERVVSWVYNSNTAKQHRDIAFYGITPDFKRVKQPYKNPKDKRIKALIAQGKGARLYDWWEVNQVKNTSAEKTAHPCQMPVDVMKRVIGILPDGIGVIDPFCGSGTVYGHTFADDVTPLTPKEMESLIEHQRAALIGMHRQMEICALRGKPPTEAMVDRWARRLKDECGVEA